MKDIKKEICRPIWAAVILFLVFYAIEIPMVLFNIFPNKTVLYTADFVIRCGIGTIALVLLSRFYKQSGDPEGFKINSEERFHGKYGCFCVHCLSIYYFLC
jgi:hypothetical protein